MNYFKRITGTVKGIANKRMISLLLFLTMFFSLMPQFMLSANADSEVTLFVSPSTVSNDTAPRADGATYATLQGAINAAQNNDTIAVTEDITMSTTISIMKDITLIASGGNYKITLGINASFWVQNGFDLTLGGGSDTEVLTLTGSQRTLISVANGNIVVNNGAKLLATGTGNMVLDLYDPKASGKITGGHLESSGSIAISMTNGATLEEISGGTIIGKMHSLYMYDEGTKVNLISGGTFKNLAAAPDRWANVQVDGKAQIGEISNGDFFAEHEISALRLIRGGKIGEISGGRFICAYTGLTTNKEGRGVDIVALDYPSGIDEISGGTFDGEIGVLLIEAGAYINTISGGTFSGGQSGLQNDIGGTIGTINNAVITSTNFGLLNVGTINEIGSGTEITGDSLALWNYASNNPNAIIKLISGGKFTTVSASGEAFLNETTVNLISGGIFTGGFYAINSTTSSSTSPAKIGTISGGVFYAQTTGDASLVAIKLANPLILEPALITNKGVARFWGNGGSIFNDESLVIYPAGYHMSTATEAVSSIAGVEFKYLTKSLYTVTFNSNGGSVVAEKTDIPLGSLITEPTLPTKSGYTFSGWYKEDSLTNAWDFAIDTVTDNITLYAKWISKGGGGSGNGSGSGDGSGTPTATLLVQGIDKQTGEIIYSKSSSITVGSTETINAPAIESYQLDAGSKRTETITIKSGENKVVFYYNKNTVAIPELETGEHIKYINGYPDGSVKPESSITRAEAAAIFFRLIKDENKNTAVSGKFSDVGGGTWYEQSVNYLASQGILKGYGDGTFKPRLTITRAEFAAIASRFDNLLTSENTSFNDVPINHWAAEYIDSAYTKGWINGYPDGSFRPASSITRAEVVKIVNTMLNRKIELNDIPSDAPQYKDLNKTHWAYCHIIEASTEHTYTRKENGYELWK